MGSRSLWGDGGNLNVAAVSLAGAWSSLKRMSLRQTKSMAAKGSPERLAICWRDKFPVSKLSSLALAGRVAVRSSGEEILWTTPLRWIQNPSGVGIIWAEALSWSWAADSGGKAGFKLTYATKQAVQ